MRSMLDELMGKERDVPLEKRSGRGVRYYDPEVCKYALAGLCPYGLFKNTKSDLGEQRGSEHFTLIAGILACIISIDLLMCQGDEVCQV